MGQNETGTGKQHKVKPLEKRRKDHQIPSPNSKLGGKIEVGVKSA